MASAEAAAAAGPILGLDHVTLAVAALDPAVAAYEALLALPCTRRRGRAETGPDWALFALANTALVLVAAGVATLIVNSGRLFVTSFR